MRIAYNSYRNRHCPKCQGAAAQRWLEAREAELLPLAYYHVVFTLPAQIGDIAFHNKAVVYDILFKAASQTLLTIAADPKHLGAGVGLTAVLHTWGSALTHHPHVHCIVPGDGDQLVLTQVLAYQHGSDRFVRVYGHLIGTNNNQEIRYIGAGFLRGDIISAEPTENAPFGFWVSVNAPTSASAYKEVLRYRSATRYGDGNPLAVIDSEMPNIEQRLGFWRPDVPLPLPAGPCPMPHLIHAELWCR